MDASNLAPVSKQETKSKSRKQQPSSKSRHKEEVEVEETEETVEDVQPPQPSTTMTEEVMDTTPDQVTVTSVAQQQQQQEEEGDEGEDPFHQTAEEITELQNLPEGNDLDLDKELGLTTTPAQTVSTTEGEEEKGEEDATVDKTEKENQMDTITAPVQEMIKVPGDDEEGGDDDDHESGLAEIIITTTSDHVEEIEVEESMLDSLPPLTTATVPTVIDLSESTDPEVGEEEEMPVVDSTEDDQHDDNGDGDDNYEQDEEEAKEEDGDGDENNESVDIDTLMEMASTSESNNNSGSKSRHKRHAYIGEGEDEDEEVQEDVDQEADDSNERDFDIMGLMDDSFEHRDKKFAATSKTNVSEMSTKDLEKMMLSDSEDDEGAEEEENDNEGSGYNIYYHKEDEENDFSSILNEGGGEEDQEEEEGDTTIHAKVPLSTQKLQTQTNAKDDLDADILELLDLAMSKEPNEPGDDKNHNHKGDSQKAKTKTKKKTVKFDTPPASPSASSPYTHPRRSLKEQQKQKQRHQKTNHQLQIIHLVKSVPSRPQEEGGDVDGGSRVTMDEDGVEREGGERLVAHKLSRDIPNQGKLNMIQKWPGARPFVRTWKKFVGDNNIMDPNVLYQSFVLGTTRIWATPLCMMVNELQHFEEMRDFILLCHAGVIDFNYGGMVTRPEYKGSGSSSPPGKTMAEDTNEPTLWDLSMITPLFMSILCKNYVIMKLFVQIPTVNPNEGLRNIMGNRSTTPLAQAILSEPDPWVVETILSSQNINPNLGIQEDHVHIPPMILVYNMYREAQPDSKSAAYFKELFKMLFEHPLIDRNLKFEGTSIEDVVELRPDIYDFEEEMEDDNDNNNNTNSSSEENEDGDGDDSHAIDIDSILNSLS